MRADATVCSPFVFEGFLARTRGSDAFKPNILQKYRPANLQTYKYRRVGVSAKAAAVLASVLQPASGGISNAREPWERWRAASARISTKTPDRKTKLPTQSSPSNTAGASRCTSRCSFSGKNAKSSGPGRQLCRCHFEVGNNRSPATDRARTTVSDPSRLFSNAWSTVGRQLWLLDRYAEAHPEASSDLELVQSLWIQEVPKK